MSSLKFNAKNGLSVGGVNGSTPINVIDNLGNITPVDINYSGTLTLNNVSTPGLVICSNNRVSTSYTTGALVVTGGVGIGGAVNTNSSITAAGNISVAGGSLGIATATTPATNDNGTRVATTAFVNAASINGLWKNGVLTPAVNAWAHNTTGYPMNIQVLVQYALFGPHTHTITISSNPSGGNIVASCRTYDPGVFAYDGTMSAIVPQNWYYFITINGGATTTRYGQY